MEFTDDYGQNYEVPGKSVVTLGSDPARCDVAIPPQNSVFRQDRHYCESPFFTVKPIHVVLWPEKQHIMILGNEQLEINELKSGDIIKLGELNLTFNGD